MTLGDLKDCVFEVGYLSQKTGLDPIPEFFRVVEEQQWMEDYNRGRMKAAEEELNGFLQEKIDV